MQLPIAGFLNLGESARLKLGIARSSDIIDSWSIDNTTFHCRFAFRILNKEHPQFSGG